METKDFMRFILIAFGIIVIWYLVVVPIYTRRFRPQAPAPAEKAEEPMPEERAEAVAEPERPREAIGPEKENAEKPPAVVPLEQPAPADDLELANELIRTYWTNRGASLRKVELLNYRAPYAVEGVRPVLAPVRDLNRGYYSDTIESIAFIEETASGETAREHDVSEAIYRVVDSSAQSIVFETVFGQKLKVRKIVEIGPQQHHVSVRLEFTNLTDEPLKFGYKLRGAAGVERESVEARELGTRVGRREGEDDYKVSRIPAAKLVRMDPKGRINDSTNIAWAAVASRYFVAVTRPTNESWIKSVESKHVAETDMLERTGRWGEGSIPTKQERNREQLARGNATVVIQSTPLALGSSEAATHGYQFICAPKKDTVLQPYEAGLTQLIDFGMFPRLGRLILSVLKFFHRMAPNYGVAILLLTVTVRVVLHPLTRKSQVSMKKMQLLQPKIAELKDRFPDDKQKMSQEQMALFRKYGVSPMSGCWPMFLQMPVFIALFGALRAAIELRQAGFLWVGDLSLPDTLFRFPFHVPLLGNDFNLLPILMAATMILSQRQMPQSADPQAQAQQKMFKWMPLIFVLFLYNMPSGLTLYWTASTTLGILEQWLTRRSLAGMELRLVGEQKRISKRGTDVAQKQKPGLLERLQGMAQQEKKTGQQLRKKKKKTR